ncbi:HK97 gp10 family phage protein [Agromyces larvae]|uniref:HK97 gp10 family phage protein n=1 Tax=Agromyces larvae TaxID=2929802 RepID=A0ABY4C2Q0_9MICO|nr:HK97 gp10 family phage protein [Agromyces larvae]UOE45474.1 HK97 gp10 family phage protein [Agromyces larvae]
MEFNNAFFEQLGRSTGVRGVVDAAAERVAATARANAPVDTGQYRNSIRTTGKMQRRYVGLVVAGDDKAMVIESRTGNLARALRANARRR